MGTRQRAGSVGRTAHDGERETAERSEQCQPVAEPVALVDQVADPADEAARDAVVVAPAARRHEQGEQRAKGGEPEERQQAFAEALLLLPRRSIETV